MAQKRKFLIQILDGQGEFIGSVYCPNGIAPAKKSFKAEKASHPFPHRLRVFEVFTGGLEVDKTFLFI